ncbi:adenosylcobinamide-GDP ribazoletransferase [Eionea flava]
MAISLMTRLPVARWLPDQWADKSLGQSALWYPFVGFLLSVLLVVISSILDLASPAVNAAVVLAMWVGFTGALHLDGLADCVDAMFASHSAHPSEDMSCPKKQTILRVLKDPSVGAMGAVTLVVLLLLKFCLLAELLDTFWLALFVALILSRTCALLFIVTTPYTPHSSQQGLGFVLAKYTSKPIAFVVAGGAALLAFVVLPLFDALLVSGVLAAILLLWRAYWIKRLDGFVGDAIGALIELSEVAVLFVIYSVSV